jgi:hypothetical protein
VAVGAATDEFGDEVPPPHDKDSKTFAQIIREKRYR